MMAEVSVRSLLADLKGRVEARAVALVARNGRILWAELPDGIYAETFGVMCATIFGAASAVLSEMGQALPTRVVAEGSDAVTYVLECGPNAVLAATVDGRSDVTAVVAELAKFVDLLKART